MSLVSNVFDTSSYKPKAKKKTGLERFADTISAPFEAVGSVLGLPDVVNTLAKPFVETYAGVQGLRGKETSRWTKEHGLQTPQTAALMSKGATDENLGALIKDKKAAGYKGANVTDILNVASLAPGLGTFAKGSKALGSASKVASGAERFLPTLGRTLKETVPAGAAWGGAYGAAGAFDQGGDIGDIGEGALVGGITGAAVGGGLGLAGASIGSLANKASRLVNKDLRAKGITDSNLRGITQLEDNNAAVRKAVDKYRKQGIDAKKLLSQTDLLVGAVDDTGTLRTTQEGGAVSQLQDFIKPQESVVSGILKREGKTVNLKDVERNMIENLDASNITGEDLLKAQNKIKREISGLRRRADKEGNIPMWLVQDAKTYKYGNIDYMNPGAKNTDKLIARTFKEIIEKGTESADIRALNKELQAHYSVLGLLERLDGKKVQGGKLGKYFAQTVGSIVGSHFGPLGSIVGAEIGGRIRGSQLKSQFSKASGKGMERSQVLLDAMDLVQKQKPTPELIPESRRLPAPAMTTPTPDSSGLLSQEEARAKLRSYGVTVDDISPQSSKSLGSLNTSQSKTTAPMSSSISKSVAEKPKLGINSIESLEAEITRRVEKFRKEAGFIAQREGAGVKMRTTDTGIDAANERTFTSFSLNQAKGTMKAQAASAKKYAQTMLYENDPEFRSLVDMKDVLLESKIVDAKTIPEVEALFSKVDDEITNLENEISAYAQADPLKETAGKLAKDTGNAGVETVGNEEVKVFRGSNKKVEGSVLDLRGKKIQVLPDDQRGFIAELAKNGDKKAQAIADDFSFVAADKFLLEKYSDADFIRVDNKQLPAKGVEYFDTKTGKFFADNEATAAVYSLQNRAGKYESGLSGESKAVQKALADIEEAKILQKDAPDVGDLDTRSKTDYDKYIEDVQKFIDKRTPKVDSPLLSEAKKYKTADEFVKAQGEPVYHGTLADFENFDGKKAGSNTEWANAQFGTFFLDDATKAKEFPDLARMAGDDRTVKVKEVYIDLKNPLDLTTKGIFSNKKQASLLVEMTAGEKMSPSDALEYLNDNIDLGDFGEFKDTIYGDIKNKAMMQKAGYDGIVSDYGDGIIEKVVFDTKQIKTKSQLLDIYKKAHGDKLGKLRKK